jgi:hypothetical protein
MPFLKTLDLRHGIRITGSAVTVGSDGASHIPIRPPFIVAPQQFILLEKDGNYMIQNSDSFGRTHVNGKPVTEQWLRDGDVIHAGNLALLYLEDKGKNEATPPIQSPSTPFQPALPELLAYPPNPELLASQEAAEPTNYEETAVSSLDGTSPVVLPKLVPRAGFQPSTVKRRVMSPAWLAVACLALLAAGWQADWFQSTEQADPDLAATIALKQSITPSLQEHLIALQLVATLPPTTVASIALAEFMDKTKSPYTKERISSQITTVLYPMVKDATEIERLSLIDGAIPSSRIIVFTIKEKKSAAKLLVDIAARQQEAITLGRVQAVRLRNENSERRQIVMEVRPGTFVFTEINEERLKAYLDLALRIKKPSGFLASARDWPAGFLANVSPIALGRRGLSIAPSYTSAAIISIDFQPIPVGIIQLPTDQNQAQQLAQSWTADADDVVASFMLLDSVTNSRITASKDALLASCSVPAATLLDDLWSKHFLDFDQPTKAVAAINDTPH